jgi:hypothetical protein
MHLERPKCRRIDRIKTDHDHYHETYAAYKILEGNPDRKWNIERPKCRGIREIKTDHKATES